MQLDTVSERELFAVVYQSMRGLAGRGASDLEDLVQTAAEQVFKQLPSFQGRSGLSTWIYAICYRVLLKQRRWYQRWSLRFRFEQEGDPVPHAEAHLLPNAKLERRQLALRLHAALQQLSETHRAMVVLHDLEELSIAEIATIVDCNELTARSRLRDARKRLRAILSREDDAIAYREQHEFTPS